MQTSLGRIANKAKVNKKHEFQNLYRLLNENYLKDVYKNLNMKSASGVDKVNIRDYGENLDNNIANLVDRLKEKKYRAKLIRRKNIPKGNGKLRPLGIPTTEDKLLQTAVSNILESIFEQDFLPVSFGYRPGVGARNAVETLSNRIQFGKFGYVLEADIKGFFNNINHDWLIRMLEERIDDKAFIQLIQKWLKAGVLEEDGKIVKPEAGTPQGGSVSAVLSNIYLHYVIDLWFEKVVSKYCKGQILLIRYADDFVCMFQYKRDVQRFYRALLKRLEKFGLEVSPEKTQMMQFNRFRNENGNRFEFLGFEFYWGRSRIGRPQLYATTSRKKLLQSLRSFKEWCMRYRHLGNKKVFSYVNAKLRGHYNYFGLRCNFKKMNNYFHRAMIILRRWLNRRSQRRSCNMVKFRKWMDIYKIEKPRIVLNWRILNIDPYFC